MNNTLALQMIQLDSISIKVVGITIILIGIVATIYFLTIGVRIGTEYLMGLAVIVLGIAFMQFPLEKENTEIEKPAHTIDEEKWEFRSRA